MNINLLDWFGYLASLIVLISLVSTSIIKLRLINMVGATLFATYGVLIGSIPTAAMNAGIVLINIYYLIKIYKSKETYQIIDSTSDSEYFKAFTDHYKDELKTTFKFDPSKLASDHLSYFILRDLVPAGMFIAKAVDSSTLEVLVDYVTPAYRDFKIGSYLYNDNKSFFKAKGFKQLIAKAHVPHHDKYLLKMGFEKHGDTYTMNL